MKNAYFKRIKKNTRCYLFIEAFLSSQLGASVPFAHSINYLQWLIQVNVFVKSYQSRYFIIFNFVAL